LYVRNELFATVYDKMSSEFEDSIWCCTNLENNNQLLVGTVYRRPSNSKENNEKTLELLNSAAHQHQMERSWVILTYLRLMITCIV